MYLYIDPYVYCIYMYVFTCTFLTSSHCIILLQLTIPTNIMCLLLRVLNIYSSHTRQNIFTSTPMQVPTTTERKMLKP